MRLVPLLMKKNRCGRCLVSMLTIMALIVSSFVLPVHTLKSGAAESTSSYGLSNPTISNGVTTWDCIYFGNYYQSNSSTKEPIKWRVLSVNGNDAFLLADQNLDAKPYNEKYTDVTWATCTLRTWLNDTFLNTAFTLAEQAAGPPLNPVEMACESFDQITAKLAEDKDFVKAFTEVYSDGLNEKNITDAIQEFYYTASV